MIRLLLILFSIVVFFFFSLIVFAVGWIIGKFSEHTRDLLYLRVCQGFCRILLFLAGTKVTYIGREKLPRDRACVYILNHRSLLDIPLSICLFSDITGYIGKKEFEKVPLLSWWIRALRGYFIDRENIREGLKTILAGIDALKSGTSIAVFPEGTRNRQENECELLEFHEGTFKLATKSGAPIVPVAISGSRAILEAQFPRIRAARVIVEVLDPIDPASLTGEARKFPGRFIRSAMTQTMLQNEDKLAPAHTSHK